MSSVESLLAPIPGGIYGTKPWSNLYVNSITAGSQTIDNLNTNNITYTGQLQGSPPNATMIIGAVGPVRGRDKVEINGDLALYNGSEIKNNCYFNTSSSLTQSLSGGYAAIHSFDTSSGTLTTYQSSNTVPANGTLTMVPTQTLDRNSNLGITGQVNANSIRLLQQSLIIAQNNIAQSVVTATSTTATFNLRSTIGSAISYSSGTFTVSQDGTYLVTYNSNFETNAVGIRELSIVVSSSGPSNGTRAINQTTATGVVSQYMTGSEVLILLSGDSFTLQLFQTSGGNLNCNGSGILTVYKLC